MKVSVVIPTYSMDRYEDMTECLEAVLSQTYDNIEAIVIVDGNGEVYDKFEKEYGSHEDVVTFCSRERAGPISRGNMGGVLASGDVIALTDDDAVPEEDWVESLVEMYEKYDAVAAGGRLEPEWVAGEAEYIPEEFYWLIGATHRGFQEEEGEVRNTFGANLSFTKDVFMELGGIKLGGISNSSIQGRESEFCARLRDEYGKGVIYNPDAVVYHKIYDYRTSVWWLHRRAFWQGYSKRGMEKLVPDSSDEESEFLRELLFDYIPDRLRGALGGSSAQAKKFVMLWTLTACVGFGYLYGVLRWR
jgi:GT2 family glycosyltransferase